jgi:hypothetical protein
MSRYSWEFYDSLSLGDIVADFCPVQQRHIHYLIVNEKKFEYSTAEDNNKDTLYYVLLPLDSDFNEEVKFYLQDLQNRFSTMKVIA